MSFFINIQRTIKRAGMASYANLNADQGADFQISVDIQDANSDPLDLTDYNLYGQVRRTYKSENAVNFTVNKSGDATMGSISILLSSAQTEAMKAGRYVYDVYAINSSTNQVLKLIEGMLEIVPSVTKNINGS